MDHAGEAAPLRVEVELTEEDLYRHHLLCVGRSSDLRFRWALTALYLPIMSGLFTWALLPLPFWITMIAVTVPAGFWLRSISLRWMIRRQIQNNPDGIGLGYLEITPTCVIEASRQVRIEFAWTKLGSPILTTEYLLFPIDARHSLIVPRRAFSTREAEAEFLRRAQEWWKRVAEQAIQA